jgi:chemotaxis protein MotB
VFALAAVLSLVVLGMGGYAYQLLGEQARLEHDVAQLSEQKTEIEAQVVTLVAEKEQGRIQAEGQRSEIEAKLSTAEARLAELQQSQKEADEQLQQLLELRKKFQRMIDGGKLEVNFRRGRMIVEMPAQVLFDSGSAELSEEGQQAVLSVAKVLRQVATHRFLVGGHTDNVPAVKEYKSNWALSAARAVGVTEALTRNGVAQSRLVVAGYSQYDPVATNASEKGRQKNRRIEIVLEPYVDARVAAGLLGGEAKPAKPAKP